ncbi:hypothetical protein JK360_16820 [Streptomyces sp. 9-7]|uniref:Uncharacterized protein n=1 Tax=Streptomyces siderophoricus TaxID=2802281 RepID=A0ABS1MTG6_9ACTN|nr:hypothetical protein [Streptomyces sp. 9-7]
MVQQGQWSTVQDCKQVLVIAHTVTYAQRLREVFSLLEADLRVQVVFTAAPHAFGEGVSHYLRGLGIATVPWEQARGREFDLALAAGSRGVHEVRAPLVRLSHGAGHIKLLRNPGALEPGEERPPGMMSRQHLMHEGRLVPAAVVYSHERDVETLARSCPEALAVAHVAGDPCYDRIVCSTPHREAYRRALGVAKGQRLVVVTSTWGPTSNFGRLEALLPQLLSELPSAEYRVAMLVHPNVWAGHGDWQVRSWLAACRGRGIAVVPPEADWQAPLIAADWVIGDHGSLTAYATLTEAPLLLTPGPQREIAVQSPAAHLAAVAPVVSPLYSLREQLDYAAARYRAGQYEQVASLLSSAPGQFHRRMRALLYRLLRLGEPAIAPEVAPVPLPPRLEEWEDVGLGEAR